MVEHKGQAGAESGRETPPSMDQIEITEAMIEAGFQEYRRSAICSEDDPLEADKLSLVKIYRAMNLARSPA